MKLKMNPRKRKIPPNNDQEEGRAADSMVAMVGQEAGYGCVDYLSMTPWQKVMRLDPKKGGSPIDEYCREQICEWSFRVVDYFRIDREVVSVSLSYLDRFLCTCSCDRSTFKLAATTTLYMAVKVVHPQKLGDLGILSDLSRGEFEMKDVAEMESHILECLTWKLHPPTAVAFSMILLDCIQLELSHNDLEDLYSNTSFFAELAVCDYFFVSVRSSTVSVACILNALEGMMRSADKTVVEKAMQLHIPVKDLPAARNRLWELYERSEECALHNDCRPPQPKCVVQAVPPPSDATRVPNSSPVSVTGDRCKATDYFYKGLRNGSW
uniref:Cyclin N-terminal domain-containing protein n=1 Tax=Cyclophora tenuis TaxID=216820 RepID=A0A7S1D4A4_CYCTE